MREMPTDCASCAVPVDEGFPASGESSQSLSVRCAYEGEDLANYLPRQTFLWILSARHFGGRCECFLVCALGFHLGWFHLDLVLVVRDLLLLMTFSKCPWMRLV